MGVSVSIADILGDMTSAGETDRMVENVDLENRRSLPDIDESRLVDFLQALKQFSRLQQEAANAQIDARQKMRDVGFKRKAVWSSDAAFMREVQQRISESTPNSFEELKVLAALCQNARDNLGPLEQEGIEAEQRWEGAFWKLRQAESKLIQDFEYEFRASNLYSSPPTSDVSSRYGSSSDLENQIVAENVVHEILEQVHGQDSMASPSSFTVAHPTTQNNWIADATMSQDTTLLGLRGSLELHPENRANSYDWDSDSGVGDIDRLMAGSEEQMGSPQGLPRGHLGSIQMYPQLLTDFSSRRDRINKWLQHTTLVSRSEATLLKNQLELENPKKPSNWSQLIIAYWELDGATTPGN